MRRFPEPISNLVAAFSALPGVGPKTALRYVYYLLKQPKSDLHTMANSLRILCEKINTCDQCYTYTEDERCPICIDSQRNDSMLCVVEESRDISTIEATGKYTGRYLVLGGTLNPIEGMTPDVIRIKELYNKLEQENDITEVILALSPTVYGETTILYISKYLKDRQMKVSRLARGLPVGATIEFADEVTLGDALSSRKQI